MIKYLFITLVFLTTISCSNKLFNNSDSVENNSKLQTYTRKNSDLVENSPKVKTYTEILNVYMHSRGRFGDLKATSEHYRDKKVILNKFGNIEETIITYPNEESTIINKYFYNDKNQLIKKIEKSRFLPDTSFTIVETEYTYVKNKLATEISRNNKANGYSIKNYKYSFDNRTINSTSYYINTDSIENDTLVTQYDKTILNKYGLKQENYYTYKNNKVKGSSSGKIIYTYNDKNLLFTEEIFDTDKDELQETRIYTYKYDKFGNWIEKARVSNNMLVNIILREITYYE